MDFEVIVLPSIRPCVALEFFPLPRRLAFLNEQSRGTSVRQTDTFPTQKV